MAYVALLFLFFSVSWVNSAIFRQGLLTQELCETKECQAAATHIKKWMNPAFNPCDDFYEFSCGYWHSPGNTTEDNKYDISLGSRDTIVNFHLKNFLLDEEIIKENRLFQMLKQFLSLCMDEASIDARGVAPAVEALKKVGGWPILEQSWSEDTWDFVDTDIALGGAFFQINILTDLNGALQIDVAFNPSVSLDDLSEGFQKDTVKDYFKKKCDFAEAFGVERSTAETEIRESMEFEIAMAKLKKSFINNSDEVEWYILPELQEDIPWVDWTKLLTALLAGAVPLSTETGISVKVPAFFKGIGKLISEHPKRAVANYVMWNAAASYADYLPAKVKASIAPESAAVPRFDHCVNIATGSSLAGVIVYYLASQTLDNTKAATEMTQNLLDELLLDVTELEWLDEKTRSSALKTLKETKLLISFSPESLDLQKLEGLYEEMKVNTSHFFEAVMDSNRNLGKNLEIMKSLGEIRQAVEINAYYVIEEKSIVITPAFLHFLPLFGAKVPAYINYGHLGGIVAHELTHALDVQAYEGDTNPNMNRMTEQLVYRWGSNETEQIYEQKKQCFIDQYSSFTDSKFTGRKLNGTKTQREDVADNGGFKLALRAYRRMAAKLAAPEPRLPTLQQYTPEQLFVISLANGYCEIPHKEALLYRLDNDSHSIFEFRIKGMLINSPEFGNVFNCATSGPMNPVQKCEVW